ncbi:MAG TPA: hypothetical protein VEA59_06220 [Patescibacteria group bacterium]|nr:hypothetical protein [Patescibacteria group bacterium]
MITPEDINLLKEFFPTREEVVTKDEFNRLDNKVDLIMTTLDSFIVEIRDNRTERTVMEHRLTKLESAVTKLSAGTGVQI